MPARHFGILLLGLLSASGASLAAQSGNHLTASPAVQVSGDRAKDFHFEVMIVADPEDPMRLLAASHGTNQPYFAHVYLSTDGGATWKLTLDSVQGGDPALAFGADHVAYYTSLTGKVYRSKDGGQTWENFQYNQNPGAPRGEFAFDREYLVVDRNRQSPFFGTVYMNGTTFIKAENVPAGKYGTEQSALAIYTSRDGGETWGNPIVRLVYRPLWVIGMANSVMLSSGSVVTLFGIRNDASFEAPPSAWSPPNSTLNVAITKPGGMDVEKQVQVASFQMNMPLGSKRVVPGSLIPWLAVDEGSGVFTDRLYAVWTDHQSGRARITAAYSSDSGSTWSEPIKIDGPTDDSTGGPDGLLPVIAVNKDGVVAATWYSQVETPNGAALEIRSTASFDGGDTWTPPIVVADGLLPADAPSAIYAYGSMSGGSINLGAGFEREDVRLGDTNGLTAAADGSFHAAWIDKRTGIQQIFTAVIAPTGTVLRNGSAALASLMDLTRGLDFKVTRTSVDESAKRVTFFGKLTNKSTDTIRGPITVRVLRAKSGLGTPHFVDALTAETGVGALLDWSRAIPAGGLLPNVTSEEVALIVEFSDLASWPRRPDQVAWPLLSASLRLLGPAQPLHLPKK